VSDFSRSHLKTNDGVMWLIRSGAVDPHSAQVFEAKLIVRTIGYENWCVKLLRA